MKIRLAILEGDQNYLNRIISTLSARYPDELEMYAFTEPGAAVANLGKLRIDVLLADDSFEMDASAIPDRCGFAYLVDSVDTATLNGRMTIGKFQRADTIYKCILNVYSEQSGRFLIRGGGGNAKMIVFQPVSGGTGSSTLAAACALHFTKAGKKALYINLEKFGSAEVFFSAEGQFDMSDVIYAVKTKRTNLSLKLESCIRRDVSGVYFCPGAKLALDMMELKTEDLERLIMELGDLKSYDYIILDADMTVDKDVLEIYSQFNALVWVSDGSEISDMKLRRATQAVMTLDTSMKQPVANKIYLVYNKFRKSTSRTAEVGLKNAGGLSRIEGADTRQLIDKISQAELFDRLV